MRIFINGIAARQGGGVTYLNHLLKEMAKRPDLEVRVFGFGKIDNSIREAGHIDVVDLKRVHTNIIFRILYEKVMMGLHLFRNNYDIAFFPSGFVTSYVPKRTTSVTMFRNMLPFNEKIKQYYGLSYRTLRLLLLKRSFLKSYRKADAVIFISQHGIEEIKKYIPQIEQKSTLIYHGVAEMFRSKKEQQKDGYVLYVSIFTDYKHQLEIARGLKLFKEKYGWVPNFKMFGYTLGEYKTKVAEFVRHNEMEDRVEIGTSVSYHDLPALYKSAKLVVFGSSCENCPNILLESMATNNPILCSDRAPMPEFLGEAGFYFDPESPKDFCENLHEALSEEERLKTRADLAFERAENFSWEKTAKNSFDFFLSTIKK